MAFYSSHRLPRFSGRHETSLATQTVKQLIIDEALHMSALPNGVDMYKKDTVATTRLT